MTNPTLGKLSALQKMQVRLGSTGIRVSPLGIGVAFILTLALGYSMSAGGSAQMISTHDTVSMKELIKASIEFAERGGDILVKIREDASKGGDLGEESKGDHPEIKDGPGSNDPVTQGDFQSHMAMTFAFKKYFTGIHVVSEEKTSSPDMDTILPPHLKNREVDSILLQDEMIDADRITIWIDPLDATQEYTEDLRQYVTTMVCIVVDEEPVAAVIHKPFEKASAWAWNKHGNLVDDSSKAPSNSIIVSRSHAGGVGDVAKKSFGDDVTVIPAGGAGYKAWALFDGTAEAYVHTTLIKKWDICPGDAILRAYGGRMTRLNGEEIKYKYDSDAVNQGGIVAALHDHSKFQSALKDAMGA